MECINCSNKSATFFFEEHVDCFHCNESNDIDYYVCRECGLIFRIINKTINEVVAQSDPSQLNRVYGDIIEQEKFSSNLATMEQMIHRCLKCNSFAYESAPGLYKCSKCDFSWEVV